MTLTSLALVAAALTPAFSSVAAAQAPGGAQPGSHAGAAAGGEAQSRETAKRLFKEGESHYDLKEYAQAVEKFRAAYRAYQDPSFLYNIAQSYRMLENYFDALDFYRSFLRRSPSLSDKTRRQVDARIAELEKLTAGKRPAGPSVPHAASEPLVNPPTDNRAEPSPSPPPVVTNPPPLDDAREPPASPVPATAPEAALSSVPTESDERAKPIYRKPWFWVVVGGVVAAAAVGTALAVGSSGSGGTFGMRIGPGASP